MKLIKTVTDGVQLLGFVIEGTEEEFGAGLRSKTIKVNRTISMKALRESNISNGQISVSNGNITYRNGFTPNSLPLVYFDGSKLKEVDNRMMAVKGLVDSLGNVVGYEILFASNRTKRKHTIEAIDKLTDIFKPTNFIVVHSDNKTFLRGTNGVKLEELPVEVLADRNSNPQSGKANEMEESASFVEIIHRIHACGRLVMLPNTKYQSAQTSDLRVGSAFNNKFATLIAGENPEYSKSKIGMTFNFKQFGTVEVGSEKVETYVIKTKSLVRNGKLTVDKIGIAFKDKDSAMTFIMGYKNKAPISEVKDADIIGAAQYELGAQACVIQIELQNMNVISKEEAKKLVEAAGSDYRYIAGLATECEALTVLNKLYNGMTKDIFKNLDAQMQLAVKGVYFKFSKYPLQFLNDIAEAGIDIHSGIYTVSETKEEESAASSTSNSATLETFEVQYKTDFIDAGKMTYNKMIELLEQGKFCVAGMPDETAMAIKVFKVLKSGSNSEKLYKEIKTNILNEISDRLLLGNEAMFAYKVANFMASNGHGIHYTDKQNWVLEPSKKKTGAVYRNAKIKELKVDVKNIAIEA